ncbi:Phage terminase, large subunit GpA [Tranquillimonas rosea]|uniref:Phage terminase, large subunit GpA n=1 Tax=Tranquillimonas rosea TaxID=641238 RepID=A0A1H9PP51_9RHOB|nr:terminase gpA endonuclease subunit [Tranquillimonas rosea]SER50041.1 Phage terminase, large subunit GpA [Tranquillimonas rosea]
MGFLTSAEGIIADALAQAMRPPPPPDITRWCRENIIFDDRSPMPGAFNIRRFPFLAEIHNTLSPEHPAREVTVRGSAQWGKTVSVVNPTVGAWHEYGPLDSLVVHPTSSAATEWVDTKWLPMRRQAPSLLAIFGTGRGGDQKDAKFNQETLARDGSLKVASAGSPDDLAGTTRRLVILDDLSKFEMTPKGDPEALAVSRASGFEDAKILRVSTPQIKGTCRITRSFARSDQRYYHVPCPHCGYSQPLTWENFEANIDPERLAAAHFTCESCQQPIKHSEKERIVGAGQWVPHNPRGDHPGFHLWRAYAPQRDWASIAVEYARVMGWTRLEAATTTVEEQKASVEAETEQTFWNDVLGLPFEQANDAPDWQDLRDRTEHAADDPDSEITVLPKGVVPASGVMLTAGVDCQDDRMELHLKAFGRDRRRWTVDYVVIPHHIGTEDGRAALNAYLRTEWPTELGLKLKIDALAIDGGTYTDDVWSWAKTHPWSRVIIVKGSSSQNGPLMVPQKFERRKDGKAKRQQKRAFLLNVSMMKGNFYTWLKQEDPTERGYCHFARGLSDAFYQGITSEVKVLTRSRTGVVTAKWELVEPSRRNEQLDTELYAEAAARRKGWASMTDDQWDALEAERGVAPQEAQGDLFDAELPLAAAAHTPPKETEVPDRASAGARLLEVLKRND